MRPIPNMPFQFTGLFNEEGHLMAIAETPGKMVFTDGDLVKLHFDTQEAVFLKVERDGLATHWGVLDAEQRWLFKQDIEGGPASNVCITPSKEPSS